MAPVFSRSCRLCRISCISVAALCEHVMGQKHQQNLERSSPEQLEELGRLQYFLDTHLGEEPVLGLEYIMEEQLDSTSYKYTCQLCNMEANWQDTAAHVVDTDHMTSYIDQQHSHLSLSGKVYPNQVDFMRDLRQSALTIYRTCGNQKIQVRKSDVAHPTPAKVVGPPPSDIAVKSGDLSLSGKVYPTQVDFRRDLKQSDLAIYRTGGNQKIQVKKTDVAVPTPAKMARVPPSDVPAKAGPLMSQIEVAKEGSSLWKVSTLQHSFQWKKRLNKTAAKQEVPSRSKDGSSGFSNCLGTHSYICALCGVLPFSVTDLCKHIMGRKHKNNLLHPASKLELKKDKLQYILDNFVKEEPIVGLEYIVEELKFLSYFYTCLLCKVRNSLLGSFKHISCSSHMALYIDRHHSDLLAKEQTCTPTGYFKNLRKIAFEIQDRYGRKKIQTKDTDLSKSETLLSRDIDIQKIHFTWNNATKKDMKSIQNCFCGFCNWTSRSYLALCDHLKVQKHVVNVGRMAPEHLQELQSLKYLLDMHLKDHPFLGLEHLVEMQVDSLYTYTCMLCNVEADRHQMPIHVIGTDHLARYIDRHYSELSISPDNFPLKKDYNEALRETASQIYKKYGRKEIQLKANIPSLAPPGETRQSHEDSSKKNDILSPKYDVVERQLQNSPEHQIGLDEVSPIQELEFRRNGDFFNYLRKFVIEDNEDASFIQQITQNCTSALVRYRDEQAAPERLQRTDTSSF